MAAGNQIPEGIIATIYDRRYVVHGQSVRPFATCLAFGLKMRAVFADAMRGINHGLTLRWRDIVARGATDACAPSCAGFVDRCRVVGFVDLVAFFVVVGIRGNLFESMLFDVGT